MMNLGRLSWLHAETEQAFLVEVLVHPSKWHFAFSEVNAEGLLLLKGLQDT